MAPWFRDIVATRADIDLHVLYASRPTPRQQGVGFDVPFTWDSALTDGYPHTVLLPPREGQRFDSDTLRGIDVLDVAAAIAATNPDVVVVPGWHATFYLDAIAACRRAGIPVLYRGDSSFVSAPRGARRLAWALRTRRRLRLFDGYLSVGTRVREYLRHFGVPEPLIFDAPAVVDNARFAAASRRLREGDGRATRRAELGARDDDYLILFAGKFVERKRPADVLAAAARLGANTVVAMAGTGALEAETRGVAARLGVRVAWCGFLNEVALCEALTAADVVAVPSRWETWGLIVNEALAAGTPVVASTGVAAEADLLTASSGARHRPGDIASLAGALAGVRAGLQDGTIDADSCQQALARHTFAQSSAGLAAAARRVSARRRTSIDTNPGRPRIMAAFGHMVVVSGLERMSFEVLRTMKERGAAVHCVVNTWESSRVVDRADSMGASWSTGYYWYRLGKELRTWPQALWDVLMTSGGLIRDARRFRPTHVFASDFAAVVRSSLALLLRRPLRVRSCFALVPRRSQAI
jgi:glycosyltransferase involved in cell wall biosynthesis